MEEGGTRATMQPQVDKQQALAFKARWAAANEAELAELRATSPEQKARQLAALMASARGLGWGEAPQAEVEAVRERWRRLRQARRG